MGTNVLKWYVYFPEDHIVRDVLPYFGNVVISVEMAGSSQTWVPVNTAAHPHRVRICCDAMRSCDVHQYSSFVEEACASKSWSASNYANIFVPKDHKSYYSPSWEPEIHEVTF
jgi:hypothetical protein